jgi:hypothetical protein
MTIRLDLPHGRAAQSHPVHGRDSVPDSYGEELFNQAVADGANAVLQRKLRKILGI